MHWLLRALIGALLLPIWGCSAASRSHQVVSVAAREADQTALLHFIAGKTYGLKGNYHAAIIELQEAATIDSMSPTIYLTMAQNYLYLDKTDNAISAARKAIQIDKRATEGYRFLVSLYERKGDMEGVAKNLEHIIALEPKDVETYFLLADAYMALEQNDAAISTLKKLEKRRVASPKTQIRMAAFYGALGQNKEARRLYREGLQKDPSHVLAWLGLGIIFESQGKKDEAIDTYEQALVSNPLSMDIYLRLARLYDTKEQVLKSDDPDFLLLLAQALAQGDKHDLATRALEKTVRVGRDNPDIWLDVARTYSVDMDSLHRATSTLEKAIEVLPDNGDLYLALGEVYEEERKWDQAFACFQKALTFDPEDPQYLFGLASFLEQAGRFDESVATFEKLLAIDADHGYALNYLGYVFADKGIRLQEALELIGRALEVEPNNGAFLDSMGWVHFRLGHYTDAEKYLDKAVQTLQFERMMGDEERAIILDHMGDVKEVQGKLDEARAYWSKSLEHDGANQQVREKLERISGKESAE